MGKTLRRCDSSRWICLTWKVITRYGFQFFFRWFLNYKFPSSRTRLSWSSPTQRVDDWRHRRDMTAQINICGELAEKVVRLLLRKIIYDWPAGHSGCLGFSEWRLLELGRRCRNRSDLVGACYDHYVNRSSERLLRSSALCLRLSVTDRVGFVLLCLGWADQ